MSDSFKPWFWISAERAHQWAPFFINALAKMHIRGEQEFAPFDWRGLHFRNRMGVAGGVDKDALQIHAWEKFGAGFIEIGTVTLLPQSANPGRVVDRDIPTRALWNKLGFPSRGADFVQQRLKEIPKDFPVPLFVNIGKNRDTPNEAASKDYITLVKKFESLASALVINISSPNTKGLRDLQNAQNLRNLLSTVRNARSTQVPLILKLSPDLEIQELEEVLTTSFEEQIDGWILTNTTRRRTPDMKFSAEGGVSGQPLAELSKRILRDSLRILGPNRNGKIIISAGGILSGDDVQERLDFGADLVQTYSGLIYSGPWFFESAIHSLRAKL